MTKKCSGCRKAVFDCGKWMCTGVSPIALVEDVEDDDCPRELFQRRAARKLEKKEKTKKQELTQAAVKVSNPGGDRIHNPDHYNWKGEECIYLIRILCRGEEGFEGYCKGNILKYIYREKKKNGIEDLKKARVYLDLLINYREARKGGKAVEPDA